jgi:hypothetical protein
MKSMAQVTIIFLDLATRGWILEKQKLSISIFLNPNF